MFTYRDIAAGEELCISYMGIDPVCPNLSQYKKHADRYRMQWKLDDNLQPPIKAAGAVISLGSDPRIRHLQRLTYRLISLYDWDVNGMSSICIC
jgi:hypothetical protein